MKAVIQRVKKASVIYENIKEETGKGLVILLGVGKNDTEKDISWLSEKILNLRIFADDKNKFNFSVADIKGDILVVSQFTLYGDCQRGRRPDFTNAAPPEKANILYEKFVREMKKSQLVVKTGKFAADMTVEIHNEGPVTILMDTER
ncbi:MAG: D-tyrosyl-tRNA(Tyr) deacylase [Elusimicrobia bacterium CG06_land_8_20_14_3_00_38_11]|nr:MAG: D-tyrosyl-tRNA(Tyr) deacylase [Elusimicrobia bacterium CG06_land_8_20_14_3_00_38_11]